MPYLTSLCLSVANWVAAAEPNWQALTSGTTASLRGISVASASVIWVGGAQGTLLKSVNGGQSWTSIAPTASEDLDFRDIEGFDGRHAIAMSAGPGQQSKLYKTVNGGEHWELSYQNEHANGFYDGMAFWNRRTGILYGDAVDGRFLVLTTHDGGHSWSETGRDTIPLALSGEHAYAASGTGIAVAPGGHAWFATGGAAARVFHSTDYGTTWTVHRTPILSDTETAGIFSIAFRDSRHGVAVGGDYQRRQDRYPNVAITEDGGRHWSLAEDFPVGLRSVVAYLEPQLLLTVGSHGSNYSIDGGRHWQIIGDDGYYAFDHHGHTAWAVGSEGRIGKLHLHPRAR